MTPEDHVAYWDERFKNNPPPPLTDEQIVDLRAAFNVDAPPARERSAA